MFFRFPTSPGSRRGLRGLSGGPLFDQQQALRRLAYQKEQQATEIDRTGVIGGNPLRSQAAELRAQADAMVAAVQRESAGGVVAAPDTRRYDPATAPTQAQVVASRGGTMAVPSGRVYDPATARTQAQEMAARGAFMAPARATAEVAPLPTWGAPPAPLPLVTTGGAPAGTYAGAYPWAPGAGGAAPAEQPVPVAAPGGDAGYQPPQYQPGRIAASVGPMRASTLGPMPTPVRFESPRVATAPLSSSLLTPAVLGLVTLVGVGAMLYYAARE